MPKPQTQTAITTRPAVVEKLARKAVVMLRRAQEYVINSKDSFDKSWNAVQILDATLRGDEGIQIAEQLVKSTHTSHRLAVAQLNGLKDPLLDAKKIILRKRVEYTTQLEREAQAQREREREAAHKKQIAEAEKTAKKLERGGDKEVAAELRERARTVAPMAPPAAPVVEKVEGEVVTTVWLFKIIDESLVPAKYRTLDESLIRKDVSNFKGQIEIPGVYIWPEKRSHTVDRGSK